MSISKTYKRHVFWGAGEPDCPKDIKAANGELHTMRCKNCDDPRSPVCEPRNSQLSQSSTNTKHTTMDMLKYATTLTPAKGYLLAVVEEASVSDGGIILPNQATLENKKKIIVVKDPSGTYAPGTLIYPKEAIGCPAEKGRDYVWVHLDVIYGSRQ